MRVVRPAGVPREAPSAGSGAALSETTTDAGAGIVEDHSHGLVVTKGI